MYGLRIIDPSHWHENWSAQIGRTLNILNSTYNLFVFGYQTEIEDILKALEEVPPEAYALIRLHPADASHCEILTDSGQCYEIDRLGDCEKGK